MNDTNISILLEIRYIWFIENICFIEIQCLHSYLQHLTLGPVDTCWHSKLHSHISSSVAGFWQLWPSIWVFNIQRISGEASLLGWDLDPSVSRSSVAKSLAGFGQSTDGLRHYFEKRCLSASWLDTANTSPNALNMWQHGSCFAQGNPSKKTRREDLLARTEVLWELAMLSLRFIRF